MSEETKKESEQKRQKGSEKERESNKRQSEREKDRGRKRESKKVRGDKVRKREIGRHTESTTDLSAGRVNVVHQLLHVGPQVGPQCRSVTWRWHGCSARPT